MKEKGYGITYRAGPSTIYTRKNVIHFVGEMPNERFGMTSVWKTGDSPFMTWLVLLSGNNFLSKL
jgi:hypothetical protein